MHSLRCIILDDEEYGRKNLETILSLYCPEVTVVGMAKDVKEAKVMLSEYRPDLLFLDIEMPHINGLDFLESLKQEPDYQIILVTAHDHYAVQAFKTHAIDYLLKPIDIPQLRTAVTNVAKRLQEQNQLATNQYEMLGDLFQTLQKDKGQTLLALPRLHGCCVVNIQDFIHLEADNNYTYVHLANRKPELISKTLKEFEYILDSEMFFRIHKGGIINLKQVREYSRLEGGYVIMSNGDQISIARRKQAEFIKRLENWAPRVK